VTQTGSGQPPPPSIAAAYDVCKKIAKREAKNFYYAFRVLPRDKRLAMCAIYAFMRRADDIADDETHTVEERRTMMAAWLKAWRASSTQKGDPVFVAVRDTQSRFNIGDSLLEELVQGTSMDLAPDVTGKGDTAVYLDFAELYRYCYLVASVVGLVCIRIFGYSDLRAERLAEETGIAFQLTNILRDVKEDAKRNRVYLPLDLLAKYSSNTDRIRALAEGERLMPGQRAMLRSLGEKAELFYASADELLPLIDRDSRAALWVLVTIYRNLLRRIARADYDVFTRRVSLPTASKLLILAEGAAKGLRNRVLA
jgi:phytoene synthase